MSARALTLLLSLFLLGAPARAQLLAEGRFDAFLARTSSVQIGGALGRNVGEYLRVSLTAAGGTTLSHDAGGFSGRLEGVAHFLLDPDLLHRWGPYLGGGLGARFDEGRGWQGALLLLVGLERRHTPTGAVPFVEVGYGGGARLGLGIRAMIRRH